MLRSLSLFLLMLPAGLSSMKMAKIFGKVESGPDPMAKTVLTMKLCFDTCYETPECVLAEFTEQDETCALYDDLTTTTVLNVVETDPASLSYVAFKTTLPDNTCPVSFNMIYLTFIDPVGQPHPWKSVEPNGFKICFCEDHWKRFDRENGISVCMRRISMSLEFNKTTAASLCEASDSSIIGVETQEEADWMGGESFDIVDGTKVPTITWLDGKKEIIVIDGSKNIGAFSWSNDLTTADDMIYGVRFMPNLDITTTNSDGFCYTVNSSGSLNTVPCGSYTARGVMCGYELM